ncbi:hypothetical protein HAX54_036637, partial [Datura stramonium]|nr:hypothetical protein [Datura stramonium]
ADIIITLSTKTNKDAPVIKRAKYIGNKTPPTPSASTPTSVDPFHIAEFHNPTPPDFLNIAQRDKIHEDQLVR